MLQGTADTKKIPLWRSALHPARVQLSGALAECQRKSPLCLLGGGRWGSSQVTMVPLCLPWQPVRVLLEKDGASPYCGRAGSISRGLTQAVSQSTKALVHSSDLSDVARCLATGFSSCAGSWHPKGLYPESSVPFVYLCVDISGALGWPSRMATVSETSAT